MFSCKQYYKYINNLYISTLTARKTPEKHIQTFKVLTFKHICFQTYKEFCKVGTYK